MDAHWSLQIDERTLNADRCDDTGRTSLIFFWGMLLYGAEMSYAYMYSSEMSYTDMYSIAIHTCIAQRWAIHTCIAVHTCMYTSPYSDLSLPIYEMTLVRPQVPNKSRRVLERRDVKTCVNLEIPAEIPDVGGRLSSLGSLRNRKWNDESRISLQWCKQTKKNSLIFSSIPNLNKPETIIFSFYEA